MPERSSYDHGTPSWIDLMTPDTDGAKAFYGELFGWTAEDMDGPDGEYIYTNLYKDEKLVCGMGPLNDDMADMPPAWTSYINVDDAEQVAKSVEAAGGQVLMPVMQVMEEGTMALFTDPAGAAFGVWQPANHKGAGIVNEPDTYSWNELMSRDIDASKAFYTQVFGWEYDEMDMETMTYSVVKGGHKDEGRAGLMPMPAEIPEQVPSYWGVYFTVADADATVARAKELGGSVMFGPDDTPVGRLAAIVDPQGGNFSIMQPSEPSKG